MSYILRDYQSRSVELVRAEISSGKKKVVMVLPTGAGKQIIFAEIIRLAIEKGTRVLWLVHRRNLVMQMSDVLNRHGVKHGIIMAGIEHTPSEPVQIGTVQTYTRRLNLDEPEYNPFFVNAGLVLIDEVHRLGATVRKVINLYSERVLIGCTATPARGDGMGLGVVFDALVDAIGVSELTDRGFLSPARYFAPTEIDTTGIKTVRGDFENKGLAEKCDNAKITGDVVENWLKIAGGQKTMVFAVNVRHSMHLRDAFIKAGIAAEHLDAKSTDDERDAVFARVESGKTTVICNVALYQEGLDVPGISCVVMARPTKSLSLYRQCCGRGLRVLPGKECCTIIDHGGNIARLGFLDDDVEWSLDSTKQAAEPKKRKKKENVKTHNCPACGLVYDGQNKCPDCGTPAKLYGKDVETAEAELEEIGPKKANKITEWGDKRRLMGALRWHCQQKGYKDGWAANSYKDYFGVYPNDERVRYAPPIKPEGHIDSLLKHILIKKAKQFQKKKRAEEYAAKSPVEKLFRI